MSYLNSMNISASAMTAQRMRLDIASENIANADTTRTENGTPYRRKQVVFEAMPDGSDFKNMLKSKHAKLQNASLKGGVRVSSIIEDQSDLKPVYNPNHPDADENGYVMMPNVEVLKETVDAMSATRSYDANITAFNAIKQMASKALDIGK